VEQITEMTQRKKEVLATAFTKAVFPKIFLIAYHL